MGHCGRSGPGHSRDGKPFPTQPERRPALVLVVLQAHGVRPKRERYIYSLSFSTPMPGVQHQLAINPQPGSVVVENRKAVRATFKIERTRKTAGEVVGLDKWIWGAVTPLEVNGRLVPGDHRRTADGLVVPELGTPIGVVLQENREVEEAPGARQSGARGRRSGLRWGWSDSRRGSGSCGCSNNYRRPSGGTRTERYS